MSDSRERRAAVVQLLDGRWHWELYYRKSNGGWGLLKGGVGTFRTRFFARRAGRRALKAYERGSVWA